jgi:hypothetical protein
LRSGAESWRHRGGHTELRAGGGPLYDPFGGAYVAEAIGGMLEILAAEG